MKLLVDCADIEKIKKMYEFYPVDGVTTNPSILAATGKAPYTVLKEIREFIRSQGELHVQVVAGSAVGMVEDGYRITQILGKNTFIKIPAVPEGFKAMKRLCNEGFAITATAVYTPMQAYLAGKCGAVYAAPYVNRIDNFGYDGIQTAKEIHDIFKKNMMKTEILAASFKNSQQVLDLCKYGVGSATLAPSVLEGLVKNQAITAAIADFSNDFSRLPGCEGKTMSTCLS
ncbi:MAG: hypothetical protein LKF96_02695 [Treponema sp.]|jgi:TalC/MipB family fructose-6-phosphate aldolase|nr:hypothetical protein [Treponema sp.]